MWNLDNNNLIFFDVEVFKFQSCVVFKNIDGKTVKIFTDNVNGLGEYFDSGVLTHSGYDGLKEFVKDKVLVGYNNYNYDNYILHAMINQFDCDVIKQWNDSIVVNNSTTNMKKITDPSLDVFQQIDVSRPSLKKIEANLGKSIIESSVDFNIDRKLTPAENLSTIQYCEYDVLQTITIFKMRRDYFDTKMTIVDMIEDENLKTKAMNWNTTSIVGQILAAKEKKAKKNSRFVSDSMLELVPVDVKEMWQEIDSTIDFKFKKRKAIVHECGNIIEFGWGGLHGAVDGVFEARDVKLLDVTSMYPTILINFNGLGDKTSRYEQIKNDRVKIKESGLNPELNKAYKLILNSTYGLLNNQYSQLNNPMLAFSICIYGQISLYVLTQMLHNVGCKVFNINTDGVAFIPDINDNYKRIVDTWEKQFKLTLEEDEFSYWIQKDVNNYVAVTKNGYIKTKGGDTNNYTDYEEGGRNYLFNNSNIRIVQKALVNKLVYGKSINDTIIENVDNKALFQYVLQAGGTYQGTFDSKGNKLQNVNRVFAKKGGEKYEIFKKRLDGGLVKFPDAPNDMIVYNGDLTDFKSEIDLQWYCDLAKKAYERWRV